MSLTFTRPQQAKRYAKVLLLGEAGSGKTHAALTFPRPAVIDAEGSIDWFSDRFEFTKVATKSYTDTRDLIKSARTGNVACETLVIDSLTSIYNGLLNAVAAQREDLRPLDWGRIKRKFSQMLDELYHQLPMHVVCVGWIKTEYAKPGTKIGNRTIGDNDLVSLGKTFDGDKKAMYAFDFIFEMTVEDGRYWAKVVKSRSAALKAGQRIENFSWKTIAPLLPNGGAFAGGMTDEQQIARDSGVADAYEPPQPALDGKKPIDALFDRYHAATGLGYETFATVMKGLTMERIAAKVAALEADHRGFNAPDDAAPQVSETAFYADPTELTRLLPPADEHSSMLIASTAQGRDASATPPAPAPTSQPKAAPAAQDGARKGRSRPAPESVPEPPRVRANKRMQALFGELGYNDDERHELQELLTGFSSSRDFPDEATYTKVIAELEKQRADKAAPEPSLL